MGVPAALPPIGKSSSASLMVAVHQSDFLCKFNPLVTKAGEN